MARSALATKSDRPSTKASKAAVSGSGLTSLRNADVSR
jgi:hypothetical protein